MSTTKIVPRWSTDRGHGDHGWLKTFNTFSVGWDDKEHLGFGSLRIINEDRVEPGTGFGLHPHREFEIFSYVVGGELAHNDSMGNTEILKRGDIQLTSAGTGIRHAEKQHGAEQVHFLQIWAIPSEPRLKPQYFTRHFEEHEKKDKWARVVAPTGTKDVVEKREAGGPAPVHSPVTMYASIMSPQTTLSYTFPPSSKTPDKARKGYVQVVQTSGYNASSAQGATVKVSGEGSVVELKEGDGAYIWSEEGEEIHVQNVSDRTAEVLLFDIEG